MSGNVRVQILMAEKAYQAARIDRLKNLLINRELGVTVSPSQRRTSLREKYPHEEGGVMPLTSRDLNKATTCKRCATASVDTPTYNLREKSERDELEKELKEYVKYMVSSFIQDGCDQTCG